MPVYNAGRYLSEAIESILNQTFRDFEFLIIDDGSADNSIEIVRSYSDPRIRFVQNEKNMGITPTLNKGIELSTCELIARMDADDVCYPERLEKQFAHFQKDPGCALVGSWVTHMTNDGMAKPIPNHKMKYYYFTSIFNCWICHPTVMYRKSAVQDVGMYSQPYSEDFNLWSKLMQKYRFHIIPEPLLKYRASETSLWRVTKKIEYKEAHLEQVIENVHYYTGKDFPLSLAEAHLLRTADNPVLTDDNDIITVFKKLDVITSCVISRNNVNKISNATIKKAALRKKREMINQLIGTKSKKEVIALLFKLSDFGLLYTFFLGKVQKYVSALIAQKRQKTKIDKKRQMTKMTKIDKKRQMTKIDKKYSVIQACFYFSLVASTFV